MSLTLRGPVALLQVVCKSRLDAVRSSSNSWTWHGSSISFAWLHESVWCGVVAVTFLLTQDMMLHRAIDAEIWRRVSPDVTQRRPLCSVISWLWGKGDGSDCVPDCTRCNPAARVSTGPQSEHPTTAGITSVIPGFFPNRSYFCFSFSYATLQPQNI